MSKEYPGGIMMVMKVMIVGGATAQGLLQVKGEDAITMIHGIM